MDKKKTTHYPRGQMCLGCTKLFDNCSHLPFNTMYSLETDPDGMQEVRCTHYDKKDKEDKTNDT